MTTATRQKAEEKAETLPPVMGLHGKIALVLGEMERVAKTGWNEGQKYKFAAEGDVVDMVRASLAQHGIAYHVTMTGEPRLEPITSAKGTAGDRCHVSLRFTLTDADDPDDREVTDWWGYADDYQDKALGKAITGAKKSYLVARFLVSTGEPEPDGAGEQRAAHSQQAAEVHPDSRPMTDTRRRGLFALAREKGIDAEFVRLSARLMTRTRELPHGVSLSEFTAGQGKALEMMLHDWDARPATWDDRMGKLAAALAEQAEQTAASAAEPAPPEPATEPEPEDHKPTCTCGAGADAPADQHEESCSMAIPF